MGSKVKREEKREVECHISSPKSHIISPPITTRVRIPMTIARAMLRSVPIK